MMQQPWDCAQPDEWLPQSLRLCWGSGDSGGGDSGGGWGDGGGFTGGGDWGSAGSFDASGFDAGGIGAWGGSAYDASVFGTGAGGGGDWGSFGDTNYSGFNAPNPTFADIAGPNAGVTTGGGDWGSAGAFSAGLTGGGPGGAMFGDYGGGGGGGLFGDYGGGGGGGFTGGGGQGGGAFGAGSGGRSSVTDSTPGYIGTASGGRDVTGSEVSSPYADDTGPAGRGESEVSSPYADDTGPEGRGEQEGPTAPSDFGKPSESEAAPTQDEAAPEVSTSIPGGRETNFDYGPQAAPAETETAPSVFGPESVTSQEGRQALSDLTQSALAPSVNWDAIFEGAAGPSQAYQQGTQDLSNLTQSALTPADPAWGSVFEGTTPSAEVTAPAIEASIPGGRATDFDFGQPDWGAIFEGAAPQGDLATQLGLENITANPTTIDNTLTALDDMPGMTSSLAQQLGLNDLTVAPGLGAGHVFGVTGMNYAPLAHDPTAPVNVEIVPAEQLPAPPPPTPQEVQPQQPQEAQPAQPQEAQPQEAQPQEAQPAPPQEAQPQEAEQAQPQQVEQTQPPEAQPAPPSLIEQAQQPPPQEAQPAQPPGLVTMLTPPALTPQVQPTEAPQQPGTPMPQARPFEAPPAYGHDVPVPVGPFVALPGKPATGVEANIPANPTTGMPAMKGIDTTNNGKNGGTLGKVEAIITHFSGGKGYTIGALVSQMMKGGAGYNIAVDKDGTAYQLRPDGVTAGHVGDRGKPSGKGNFAGYFNNNSIGVAALAENEADLTPAQIAKMKEIVTALGKAHNVPPSQVFGHAAVDRNRGGGEGSTISNWAKGLPSWDSAVGARPPANVAPVAPPAIPRPPADIPASGRITFYAPGAGGRMEGKYETSRPNPNTGKNIPSTLDDVRLGKSPFVTLAADPSRYGESVNLGTINYKSPIDGKTYTLPNVQGIVHDTGSAFKGKLDKLDVAVGNFQGWKSGQAQAFVASNSREQPATPTATNLPPPALPLAADPVAPDPVAPRPPADIPVTLTPPARGRADPALQARTASQIAADLAAKGPRPTSMSTGQVALNGLARALAQAGIPAAIAQQTVTETARAGSRAAGYDPDGIASSYITSMTGTAMQGYQPARPGEVQGPPSPFAPGKQGALPSGQQYADLSQSIGRVAPSGMTGRPGEIGAQQPMFSIPGLDRLSPITAPPVPPEAPVNPREQASLFDTRFLAKGGHVAKDEPVVVGEEGPETFVPDQSGTVFPHVPQPGKGKNIDRWPKIPAPDFPGRYGGVEREMLRQTREAQDPSPGLMDMIDSGRLPLNEANWHRLINNPSLIALGRSRFEDRRTGIDPGAEQYGAFVPAPAPAAEPPDPNNPMAQALGYGSIKRRPMQIGRQSY